ncbi:hypothetical protein D3C80_1648390 [compost metagenome]
MEDVFKTLVHHIGTGFLTADTASTIHYNILVLLIFQHFCRHRQLLSEGIGRHFYSPFKMPHFILVVVAHIYKDGLFILNHLVYLICFQVFTHTGKIEAGIINPIGNDLVAHFQPQHPE